MALGSWYRDLAINREISKRDDGNQKKYRDLAQFASIMREKLDAPRWYVEVAYTPHDFSHHIKNVLSNLSTLMENHLDYFSIDELLALQYACILHDIDMVYNPYQREIHALNAAAILAPFEKAQIDRKVAEGFKSVFQDFSDFCNAGNVPNSDVAATIKNIHELLTHTLDILVPDMQLREAISYIILGHSNIKLKSAQINTLDKVFYKEIDLPLGPRSKQMKLRVLACLLRLADELDCSKNRIAGLDNEVITAEAKDYWDRLRIVSSVCAAPADLALNIDKSFSNDIERNCALLYSVEKKIHQEIAAISKCFGEEQFHMIVNPVRLIWVSNEHNKEDYQRFRDEREQEEKKNRTQAKHYNVEGLIQDIRETIDEKNLYREVHRRVSHKCLRNYLDCNGLLTRHQILDGVSQVFLNILSSGDFSIPTDSFLEEDLAFVGVANSGALIAAHMSQISGKPMVYFVPPNKMKRFTEPENEMESYAKSLENRKIVLVIGVNHTGESILAARSFIVKLLEPESKDAKIHCVLGIVDRSENNEIMKQLHAEGITTHFLINDYPIDWCGFANDRAKCPYGHKCKTDEYDETNEDEVL